MHGNPILTSANAFLGLTNYAGNTASAVRILDGLPLGTADGSATAELGVKVVLVGGTFPAVTIGAVTQSGTWTVQPGNTANTTPWLITGTLTAIKGAANLATAQVTSTGSAATLAIARATRRSILIRNTDAANAVWVGPATVTTGNGMLLKAGEAVALSWVGLIQVIDNGSHAAVAIADEYD